MRKDVQKNHKRSPPQMNDNNHGDILKRRKNKQEQHIKNVFARIFFNVWILKLWDFDVWLYVCFLCLASFKLHDNIILSNANAQTNIQTQIHWIRCQSNERKKQNWVNICSNTDLQWSADVKYWALLKLIKMMEHRLRLMCVCVCMRVRWNWTYTHKNVLHEFL